MCGNSIYNNDGEGSAAFILHGSQKGPVDSSHPECQESSIPGEGSDILEDPMQARYHLAVYLIGTISWLGLRLHLVIRLVQEVKHGFDIWAHWRLVWKRVIMNQRVDGPRFEVFST